MDTILKLMVNLSRAGASETAASPSVPTPASAADPSAVAEFSKIMHQGLGPEGNRGGGMAVQNPDAVAGMDSRQAHHPVNDPVYENPTTLGEKLTSARSDQGENSSTKQWLNTVTDIFEKETLSYPDLYRAQVLAGMAQIETTRNSSVSKSMDEGLKTLLKNT